MTPQPSPPPVRPDPSTLPAPTLPRRPREISRRHPAARRVDVECASPLAYGQTVCDIWHQVGCSPQPLAIVTARWDSNPSTFSMRDISSSCVVYILMKIGQSGKPPNVHVAVKMDVPRFWDLMCAAVDVRAPATHLPAPSVAVPSP